MTASRHPSDALLMAYAAGSLGEPTALLVATHLALCPRCRSAVADAEAVGGALMEDLAPAALNDGALESVLARLDSGVEPPATAPATAPAPRGDARLIPQPLRGYLPTPVEELPWRPLGPGIHAVKLLTGRGGDIARLYRIGAGRAVPRHGHRGNEMTLVLTGAYRDDLGRVGRGDVAEVDDAVTHQPVAEPTEDCICLVVTDAPLRLTGAARLMQPFMRT